MPKRRDAAAPAYVSTEQRVNYNRGSAVAEDIPEEANAVGDSGKNDRDRNTLSYDNSLRVYSFRVVDSRQDLDSNQSNYSYIRSSTRIPRIICACTSGIL